MTAFRAPQIHFAASVLLQICIITIHVQQSNGSIDIVATGGSAVSD